jgi:ribosome-associated protein
MHNEENSESDFDDSEGIISKTAIKKAMHELRDLSENLLNLNTKQLSALPLSDTFISTLEDAKKMKSGNARRRHIQLLGKLIRSEDIEGIKIALERQQNQDRQRPVLVQRAEEWCQKLIEEGKPALSSFISEYPDCDRQRIGQLIRNFQKHKKSATEQDKDANNQPSNNSTNNTTNNKHTSQYQEHLFKTVYELIYTKNQAQSQQ